VKITKSTICDFGHRSIAVGKYFWHCRVLPIRRGIMSFLSHTHERADLKHRSYSLILALVCMWLALAVANAVFAAFA
jgi:hypothetical protein